MGRTLCNKTRPAHEGERVCINHNISPFLRLVSTNGQKNANASSGTAEGTGAPHKIVRRLGPETRGL